MNQPSINNSIFTPCINLNLNSQIMFADNSSNRARIDKSNEFMYKDRNIEFNSNIIYHDKL